MPEASTSRNTGFINSLGCRETRPPNSKIQFRAPSFQEPSTQGVISARRHKAIMARVSFLPGLRIRRIKPMPNTMATSPSRAYSA